MMRTTLSLLPPILLITAAVFSFTAQPLVRAQDSGALTGGWQAAAPREEIRPNFSQDPKGGPNGADCLTITADQRDGLHGYWQKTFAVAGGKFYKFHAVRKTYHVAQPRRSAVARVLWRDDNGKAVRADPPDDDNLKGSLPLAEPEYPGDGAARADGWTEVSGVYRAPMKATRAVIELHLQWAPQGRIDWAEASLTESA